MDDQPFFWLTDFAMQKKLRVVEAPLISLP